MAKVTDYRFSFRKKDGGIQIILSYKDALGKWRQKSRQGFATMKDAKAAKYELRAAAEKECGLTRDRKLANITLSDFLQEIYLRDRPSFSASSAEIYTSAVNGFWADIADIPIRKITEPDIINIINGKQREVKIVTVNMRIAVLRAVLKYAVDPYQIISSSPAEKVKPIRTVEKQEQRPALTEEQLQALLDALHSRRYQFYVMASLAAYAGLRVGEILGISWEDIDIPGLTITVRKQFGRNGPRNYKIKRLKTKNSYRTIPIPPTLARTLREWKGANPIRFDGLVFSPKASTYTQYNTAITTLCPGATSHSLRHTYATNLIRHGADIKTVAALIGDTVEMAMKVYVNYTDDMRSAAAKLISDIF